MVLFCTRTLKRMPFKPQPARPFTPVAARTYAPAESGVYGIANARGFVLIGETDNIRQALLNCMGESAASSPERPNRFLFQVCEAHTRRMLMEHLIEEYQPMRTAAMPSSTPSFDTVGSQKVGDNSKSGKTRFVITGFEDHQGFRAFLFDEVTPAHKRIPRTVRVDLEMARRHGIRIQELPLICCDLLDRQTSTELVYPLCFPEQAMIDFAAQQAATRDPHRRKNAADKVAFQQAGQVPARVNPGLQHS